MDATQFDHYLGQKVLVNETTHLYKDMKISTYKLDSSDVIITSLRKEAQQAGLSVRLWLPDTMGTADVRMDRLNVRVEKQEDGSFQISRINIG